MAIKVLVVDDDPGVRLVLREGLSHLGYEVTEAVDGQECLDLLAAGCRPDVILLDLLMPKKTGVDVLREMQERRNGGGGGVDPPVIVMSGYFDREEFAGMEVEHRLQKPLNVGQIVLAIERALAERRRP